MGRYPGVLNGSGGSGLTLFGEPTGVSRWRFPSARHSDGVGGGASFRRVHPPTWVVFGAASAIALGTYAGGWKIIKTLGQNVTKPTPLQGFGAQTACAGILWATQHFGYPVSTTHTISGSVLGAGMTRRLRAVRWGVAGNILVAWILTLPCAALVGAGMQYVTRLPGGTGIVFAIACGICAFFFIARRVQTHPGRRCSGC